MDLAIRSDNIYPGCLVSTQYVRDQTWMRISVVDPSSKKELKHVTMNPEEVGIVISIYPNGVLKESGRMWLVYFYPYTVAISQRNIRRISLSWKERQNMTE